MSDSIQLLPDEVINQIAAGEVIERPASVVKELVENALDAQAASITVTLEGGGKQLIRIADDGKGMRTQDARLCPLRHATSKLRSAQDLITVKTNGFRGEAVSSIASVSRLTLETRHADCESGIRLRLQGGEITEDSPIARPCGTTFTVEDLFYNTPVRKAFLSSDSAETLRISDTFQRIALAHPKTRMELRQGARELFLGVPGTLRSRMAEVLGHNLARHMLPVDYEESGIRIHGFTNALDLDKGRRHHHFFYLHQRPISNPMLSKALSRVYESHGFQGYPVACLFLELPPGEYDVNVHPAKKEVRFASESTLFTALGRAVRKALESHSTSPVIQLSQYTAPALAAESPHPTIPAQGPRWSAPPVMEPQDLFSLPEAGKVVNLPLPAVQPADSIQQIRRTDSLVRYYQLARTYLVCEDRDNMILVDQAAAHQRILYEHALDLLNNSGAAESQEMLFPELLDLSKPQNLLMDGMKDALGRLGFHLEPFGPDCWQLRGIPLHLNPERARQALQSILSELNPSTLEQEDPTPALARAWCLGATLRKGDTLDAEQMAALMDQLFACQEPFTSPSGRPTLLRFPLSEIGRRFGRE